MTSVRALKWRYRWGIFNTILTTLVLLQFCDTPVLAGTISVPGDAPSIKGAMIKARAGDIVLVSCGIYRETNIVVKPGVSLWSGTLQPDCVTIDAGRQGRCLIFIDADSTTSVVGFTLRGGSAVGTGTDGLGGAILCENSAARITRCVLSDNTANHGGALAVTGSRGPRLKQSRLESNRALVNGGAVYWAGMTGSILGCTLVANDALVSGGAVVTRGGQVDITNCLLQDNTAGDSGGALSLMGTTTTITGSVLAGNLGGMAGGALHCQSCAPVLRQCTFYANGADGEGTVMNLNQAAPVLEACLITDSNNQLVTAIDGTPIIRNSNVFSQSTPSWPSILSDQLGINGNMTHDPMYCNAIAGDFHLRSGSPCLASDRSDRIGALGQGCGAQFPSDVVD